jgi:hypothetical protein
MLGFPLGILSAAGAGGGGPLASDYELISTQILTSPQSSITFSSLGTYSSTYKHLQVRAVARSTRCYYKHGVLRFASMAEARQITVSSRIHRKRLNSIYLYGDAKPTYGCLP